MGYNPSKLINLINSINLLNQIPKEFIMYSYFAGCKIPYYLPEYGSSTLALLKRFGIDLQEPEFNCCGYPVRDIDFQSFLLAGYVYAHLIVERLKLRQQVARPRSRAPRSWRP